MSNRLCLEALKDQLRPYWHIIKKQSQSLSSYYYGKYLICSGYLPKKLLSFGGGLGDDLLLTSAIREMTNRGCRPGVITRYPEIFAGNTDISAVLKFDKRLLNIIRREKIDVKLPWYTQRDSASPSGDQDLAPRDHIIGLMCEYCGIYGEIGARPYWTFLKNEKSFGRFGKLQVAIQSSGLSKDAKMPLKEWYPERFQAVIDKLERHVTFVQVGRSADPPLRNVVDLRGRTSVRETASVLSHSVAFVGLVGFLMHLARAIDLRSVIIFGGREAPWQTGYIANINLYSDVSCAPCWGWRLCDFERICMNAIDSKMVLSALEQIIDEQIETLPVQKIDITKSRMCEIKDIDVLRLKVAGERIYMDFPPGTR